MFKILTLVILLYAPIESCLGQEGTVKNKFINNSINYRIIISPTMLLDSNRIEISRTLVKVVLSKSQRNKIKKFSYEEWIVLLKNNYSDWAANLCLYDIFERDASFFNDVDSRDIWIKRSKSADVTYWEDYLRKNLKPQSYHNNK
jgi:hypothetical protein